MEKRNVPKLRFKGFEDEWREYKLDDISSIIMGQSPSSSEYNEEKIGLPLVQGKADIKDRKTAPRMYTKEITKTCEVNDIIMSVRAPVGDVSIAIEKCCIGRGVCAIRSNINQEYLYQLLLNQEEKWKNLSQGSTFESINSSDIKGLRIKLPSLEEQTKIANFLSSVDNIIEEQEGKVKDLEQYKKGMMQKIFKQEVRFKDENGEEYPEWEEKKLGECIVCLDNMRKPLNSTERQEMKGNIPYYGANGIVDYINDFIFDERLILLAEDGGNFDEFATRPIAQIITGKSWINNHAHVLKAKENYIDYIFYTLVHKDIRQYINGTSRAKLNKSDMLDIKIDIPCIEEQTKIANFLSNIDNIIEEEKKKLEDLKLWKKGLLQQMFV